MPRPSSSGAATTVIKLRASLAFGSGDHPTTKQCLQWLARADVNGQSVVDYGCGSGVLGIAACMLGASQVVRVVIQPACAVEVHVSSALLWRSFPVRSEASMFFRLDMMWTLNALKPVQQMQF